MILHQRTLFSALLTASVFGLTCLGCSESGTSTNQAPKRPDPEESFDEIVRFARSQIETGGRGMPSGFVAETGTRRTHFTIRNDVSSEFFPPTEPNGIYRGTITVTSRSSYTLRIEKSDNGSKGDAAQKAQSGDGSTEFGSQAEGFEALDTELVLSAASEGDKPVSPTGSQVARKEDEDVSTFEFVYENERWVLKTEPDLETERAVKRAFDRALELQP